MNCPIERRKRVTLSTLNLATGESTPQGEEWRIEACGSPLFVDDCRDRGICRGCASGWSVDGNYPTIKGLAMIAAAKAKRPRIDRIADSGDIREHIRGEREGFTLCGLALRETQAPLGNRACGRCAAIEARERRYILTWARPDKGLKGSHGFEACTLAEATILYTKLAPYPGRVDAIEVQT